MELKNITIWFNPFKNAALNQRHYVWHVLFYILGQKKIFVFTLMKKTVLNVVALFIKRK
jgi:hypothetical protein